MSNIYETIENFGTARPRLNDTDHRYFPPEQHVTEMMETIFAGVNSMLADTIFEDDIEDIAWSIVNAFQAKIGRIDQHSSMLTSDLRETVKEFDGSEVADLTIAEGQETLKKLDALREGWCDILDCAADQYGKATGKKWSPRRGSYFSRNKGATAATVELKTYLAARQRKQDKLVPDGSLVIVSGGTEVAQTQIDPIFATLDKVRTKYPDMVVMHGGYNKGVDMVVRSWAQSRGVNEVYAGNAKSLYHRNDNMLNADPVGIVAFPGQSVTDDIVKKARLRGMRVMDCRKKI